MKKRSCTRFLAACALASFAGFARAEEQAETKRIAMTLDEVRAFPEAYCRVPFEIDLLYHGPRSLYNPFFTVFEPSSFANFAAWPAESPIFERQHYLEDHPLFYYERKDAALQRTIFALKPYTWFSARCIVRSIAQGRAWIEVLAITSVGAQLDNTDLRHLVRANSLADAGEFDRALLEIEMARLFSAPTRFVAQARREEGRVALAANQPERALLALQQAWQSLPEDKLVAALLDRASAQVALLRQSQVATLPGAAPVTAPAVETRTKPKPQAPVTPVAPEVAPETEPTPPATKPQDEDGEQPSGETPVLPVVEPVVEPAVDPADASKTPVTAPDDTTPPVVEPTDPADGTTPGANDVTSTEADATESDATEEGASGSPVDEATEEATDEATEEATDEATDESTDDGVDDLPSDPPVDGETPPPTPADETGEAGDDSA